MDEKGSLPLLDVGYRSLGGFPWRLARCCVYAGLLGPKSFHSKPRDTEREREIGLDLLPRCLEHSTVQQHLVPHILLQSLPVSQRWEGENLGTTSKLHIWPSPGETCGQLWGQVGSSPRFDAICALGASSLPQIQL